jgi:hypothetical protein
MSRIRGYLAVAVASSALTALGGAAGIGASTSADAPHNTAKPTVSGTAAVGQTLTASPGGWSGTTPISYSYEWRRCAGDGADCHRIRGTHASTYKLTSDEVGRTIRVRVTAQNSAGQSTADSNPTATVVPNPDAPANTARPTITGSALAGSVLTGHEGSWSGKAPFAFSFRWQRCDRNGGGCSPIGGATGGTYTLATGDVGRRIRFQVTAKNDAGTASAVSDPTAQIAGKPIVQTHPSISGTAQQGQTLTGNLGTWAGTQPITITQWWLRCDQNGNGCTNITGATHTTYVLTSADVSHRIRFHVHAANSRGTAGSTSGPTAVVAATPTPTTPALPPGAVKLPDGTVSIPVTSVSLPDQLIIDKVQFNPAVLHSRNPFQARFRVVDTKGYVVRDALVYMIGIPYGRILNVPEQPTAQDGWATMNVQPTLKLPLVRGGALVVFVRARKPGDNVLAGVSARRLVQVKVGARQ